MIASVAHCGRIIGRRGVSARIFNLEGFPSSTMPMSTRSTQQPVGSESFAVQHDEKNKVFYIDLPGQERAVLEYAKEAPDILDFYHTEVPVSQRGSGLGMLLVQEGLNYAKAAKCQVRPTCWYVARYLERNLTTHAELQVIKD